MPHISKKKLKKVASQQIDTLLLDSLFPNDKSVNGKKILASLLTKTERIMLAKRLTIIVLLKNGHSLYRIVKVLKVSPSTVARIREDLSATYFNVSKGPYKKETTDFWDKVENFILMGMPPRVPRRGKERWKFLHES